jgi:hypothetical protein
LTAAPAVDASAVEPQSRFFTCHRDDGRLVIVAQEHCMPSCTRTSLVALLFAGCAITSLALAQAQQPTGVLFENVRILDGTADRLSAPSNLLVVGQLITAISADPIAAPAGVSLTRIRGGGRTQTPGADRQPCAHHDELQQSA